jgi:hypothetical protein
LGLARRLGLASTLVARRLGLASTLEISTLPQKYELKVHSNIFFILIYFGLLARADIHRMNALMTTILNECPYDNYIICCQKKAASFRT